MDERQMKENDICLKDAYRKKGRSLNIWPDPGHSGKVWHQSGGFMLAAWLGR